MSFFIQGTCNDYYKTPTTDSRELQETSLKTDRTTGWSNPDT